MKKNIWALLFSPLFIFISCSEKNSMGDYYSTAERDSLLTDMITYIYAMPQGAAWQTRFEPRFRNYYVNHLKDFRAEKYFISDSGLHYYYLIRPAHTAEGNMRGVGGSFKLTRDRKIIEFKEVFNTPTGDLNELRTKGDELFKWMIRTGNVNDYLKNPDFIEWPNKMTYYDTLQHQWLIQPGL